MLLAVAVVLAGTLAGFGGVNTVDILATVLTDGLIPAINLAAGTLAGLAIARRIVPGTNRALLLSTGAGIGIGILVTAGLLLGLAGLLNAGTAWGLVGLLALAGSADVYYDRRRWVGRRPLDMAAWLWLLPTIAFGVAMAAACLPPGILWGDEPHGYDVVSYHLQIPREWYEAGRIMPLEHNVFSYFPLGQETLSLLLMHQMGGPYKAMYASQLVSLLLVGVATLAVFGALERDDGDGANPDGGADAPGLPRDAAAPAVAAVSFATLPWVAMLGSVAYNEPLLILASALSAAWAIRAADGDWRPALMAGLFVGLGISGKYPAVPMLGVAGGLVLLVLLLVRGRGPADAPRAARSVALTLLAFTAGSALFALPWLLRNWAWIGNPVFPLATGVFGDGGWPPELVQRWDTAHSLADGESRIGRLFSDILANPRFAWIFWPTALAAAGYAFFRRDRAGMLLALWIGLMLAIWLGFTHLQARFMTPALAPAAILIGLAITPRLRLAGIILAGLIAVAGFVYLLPVAFERTAPGRHEEVRLYGFEDLLLLTALADVPGAAERPVYLVGDARAFLYPVDDLHYQVVFNVPPTEDPFEAWLGDALVNAPDDALVVFDYRELNRLSESYGTPTLALVARHHYIVRMRELRAAVQRLRESRAP